MELNILDKNCDKIHDFYPFFKVHKDGRVIRYAPIGRVPPSNDPYKGVRSKDVTISAEPIVRSRNFMPRNLDQKKKLPILVYFHGGGLSLGSAFDPVYDKYVTSVVTEASVVAVSVEYRLAPEHPIPACYDDSWTALQWVASHAGGLGSDPWLNYHGDFAQVFLAGDSAGANIAHNVAVRAARARLPGTRIKGMILTNPYFGGIPKHDRIWLYMCPVNNGPDDHRIKPTREDLMGIGCDKVLVTVAGKDELQLRDIGCAYYDDLKKSGWKGDAAIIECEGVGHNFHLLKPKCDQALYVMERLVSFINHEHVTNLSCRM